MKLTNRLKNEESKEECKITFFKFITIDGELEEVCRIPNSFSFVDVIAKISSSSNLYLFEAYDTVEQKGTNNSNVYIGTWNGEEQ